MSGQRGGPYQRSASGLVGALLILVLVVVGFVVLRELTRTQPEPAVEPVRYRQSAEFAAARADYEILAPARLPAGWRVTSVRFTPEPARWHLGLLTDRDDYLGVEQAEESAASLVSTYVDDEADREGEVLVDGDRWESWSDEDGDRALVRATDDVTTLVVGSVEQDVLVDYVGLLR